MQKQLVDTAIAVNKGTLLALHLGRLTDAGRLVPDQISFGKLDNTRQALEVTRTARALLGGNGITLEHPVMATWSTSRLPTHTKAPQRSTPSSCDTRRLRSGPSPDAKLAPGQKRRPLAPRGDFGQLKGVAGEWRYFAVASE